MSPVDKAREEYAALRAALAPRNHVTHHTDCGCFTIAADALIAALEAEVERLRRPFKLYDSSEMTNRIARLTARVQVTEAKLIDTAELYERMKQRAEAAEKLVYDLSVEASDD